MFLKAFRTSDSATLKKDDVVFSRIFSIIKDISSAISEIYI